MGVERQRQIYGKKQIIHRPPVLYKDKEVFGSCDIPFCKPHVTNIEKSEVHACVLHMWTKWSEWGKCNLECGEKGERKRHRCCKSYKVAIFALISPVQLPAPTRM